MGGDIVKGRNDLLNTKKVGPDKKLAKGEGHSPESSFFRRAVSHASSHKNSLFALVFCFSA